MSVRQPVPPGSGPSTTSAWASGPTGSPTSCPAVSASGGHIARGGGERRLLLADEPSGALDSVNGEAVMRLVHEACKRGVAAVVVTHDAQLASWADRVVFLRDGRIVDQTAPGPESLLTSPGQS